MTNASGHPFSPTTGAGCKNPWQLYHEGLVLMKSGRHDLAVSCLRAAAPLMPQPAEVHYHLADSLHHVGRLEEAATVYQTCLTVKPDWVSALCGYGNVLQDLGRFEDAIACYRQALSHDPSCFNANFNLGVIFQFRQQWHESVAHYQEALRTNVVCADALNNLAIILNAQGRFEEAVAAAEKAVALEPDFAEAHYNLGAALRRLFRLEEAIICFQKAIRFKPQLTAASNALGNVLQDLGRTDEAIAGYRQALLRDPKCPEVNYNLGGALKSQGRLQEARQCYRNAIEAKPDFAEAHNNLGLTLKDEHKLTEALVYFREALRLKPDLVEACFNLGVTLQLCGSYHEGLCWFRKAAQIDPGYVPARWFYHLSLPNLYQTEEDIRACRERFKAHLDVLIHETALDTAEQRRHALNLAGSMTTFWLPYQGQNDKELQKKYGQFVARIMSANFPHLARPRPVEPLRADQRIRVGYVSAFMREHVVGEYLIGWLEHHNRTDLEIFCYHIGGATDTMTERFRKHCDHFCQIGANLRAAAEQILSDKLHVLVFAEASMHAMATQLAGLRLAPVQCLSWGHPVTSGLPTMDYYLTSDLMEPGNAEEHYSEKLIRLPNLSLTYRKPQLRSEVKTRDQFGIRQNAFVYLMSQSFYKCLPQYDSVYARIACNVPDAQFVLISRHGSEITDQFMRRMAKAFSQFNLNHRNFCLVVPRLNFQDFLSLNHCSDVLLDTFCWSGGKTTLEAISCGLPVVTCPGPYMRGRHSYGILKMIDMHETIARDETHYVQIASRLGTDTTFYQSLCRKLEQNRSKLYEDEAPVRALEAFYRSVVCRLATRPATQQ